MPDPESACSWFTSLVLSNCLGRTLLSKVVEGCPYFKDKKHLSRQDLVLPHTELSIKVDFVNFLLPKDSKKKSHLSNSLSRPQFSTKIQSQFYCISF